MENHKVSAYEKAYEHIRDMIFNGELKTGEKISETGLASRLGISRTPLREAIRRLEQERLVSGNKIANPTDRDYRDIFEMRILIETFAAKKAAQFLPSQEVQELERYIQIGYNGTHDEVMEANKAFHEKLVWSTKNNVMIDYFNQMQSIIHLFRKTVLDYERPGLIDEHNEIVEAIKERDSMKAANLTQDHLEADLEFVLYYLRQ